MGRIFLAYRFTGEDPAELDTILTGVRDSLEFAGHKVYCTFWESDFFREQNFTTDQIYMHGLLKVDDNDTFLALIRSPERSKGMVMESARAISKNKRYVLAIKRGLEFPEFRKVADVVVEYDGLDELYRQLRMLSVGEI